MEWNGSRVTVWAALLAQFNHDIVASSDKRRDRHVAGRRPAEVLSPGGSRRLATRYTVGHVASWTSAFGDFRRGAAGGHRRRPPDHGGTGQARTCRRALSRRV